MLPRGPSTAQEPPATAHALGQTSRRTRSAPPSREISPEISEIAPASSREKEAASPAGDIALHRSKSSDNTLFRDVSPNAGNDRAPPTQNADDLLKLIKWRKWSIFACSCVLQFLLNLDMASVAVALPNIAKDLKADQVLVFTVATGYFLAQTVFQLVFSHVSHAVGRKWVYISGVTLYTIGAAVAATSRIPEQLIGARFLQGVGAAGMFTMSAIVTVDIMRPRQRAAWSAVSQACGALGNICGPLFAALLFKQYSWRSLFMMEIGFAGSLWFALLYLLPNQRDRTRPTLDVLKRCDWVGMLLFFLSSVAILVPINIGGTVQPWNSLAVVTCFVIGTISLGVLIYHQRCIAKNPAFPKQIFTRPVTNVAFFGSLVSGMLLSMIFYNLVLFWEGVRHLPTIEIGVMLLAVTIPYTICAALTGVAIRVWGHIKWATIAGAVVAELGLGLMYFLTEEAPVGPLVVITMLAAIGCGIYLPAMINIILASTERQWHGHAIAVRTQLYTAGQCMGISVGLAIFTNKFEYQVEAVKSIAITPQGLMRIIKDLPHNGEIIKMIVNALRWVWGAAFLIAFLAGFPACILRCPSLPDDDRGDQNEDMELQSVVNLSVEGKCQHATEQNETDPLSASVEASANATASPVDPGIDAIPPTSSNAGTNLGAPPNPTLVSPHGSTHDDASESGGETLEHSAA